MKRITTALALSLSLLAGAGVTAQEATDPHAARVANTVSHEILSPFCPGKTLAMCPSPAAAEVRMKIQDMAESGMEEPEIRDAIVEEYGEEFRIVEPPWTDDVGLLGALGGALVIAIIAVVVFSRRKKDTPDSPVEVAAQAAAGGGEPPSDDPYLEELRKQYRD